MVQNKDDIKSLEDCENLRSEDEFQIQLHGGGILESNKEERDIEIYSILANTLPQIEDVKVLERQILEFFLSGLEEEKIDEEEMARR